MQGITEFTFWGYAYDEKLDITQVPYRDINVAPIDLGEGRIQVVMSSYAIVQPQIQAGRIKLLIVNDKTRIAPRAGPADRARAGLSRRSRWKDWSACSGSRRMSDELKEKIAADFRAVAADGSIGERLKATGQVINVGGPKEFADSIDEQRANVAAVVKAIDFKPKN